MPKTIQYSTGVIDFGTRQERRVLTAAGRDLVAKHEHLVRMKARQIGKLLPAWVPLDELVSLGYVGLVEAAIRFDASRHASFAVWAQIRIRGAILDGFRGRKWPRLQEALPEMDAVTPNQGEGWDVTTRDMVTATPDLLVERRTPESQAIEQEESAVMAILIDVAARAELTELERTMLAHRLAGADMGEVAARYGKYRSWPQKIAREALAKLRAELERQGLGPAALQVIRGKKAA